MAIRSESIRSFLSIWSPIIPCNGPRTLDAGRHQVVEANVAERAAHLHVPSGEKLSIYDASLRYQREGTPLVVIAGKEYGSGSSRDWAAEGSALLGIKAVIAQTYERIHRSNLVCMGVLPLQFETGASPQSLGLTGFETFSITGIGAGITPRQTAKVTVTRQDGSQLQFTTMVRIDSPAEVEYFLHGGILQMVLRQLLPARADFISVFSI